MKLLKFFKNFYGVYAIFILASVVFISPFLGFQFKRNYAIGNILLFVIGLLIAFLLFLFIVKIKNQKANFWKSLNSKKAFYSVIGIGALLMLAMQAILIFGAWFIAGWDTRNIIFPDMQMDNDYMSMYPNQIFLAGIFRQIYFFLTLNFNFSFDNYYLSLVIISALMVTSSVLLITFAMRKIKNEIYAIFCFICCFLFLGVSPWILIPYSDTIAMFCVSFVMFAYVVIKAKYVKWPVISFVSIIGYYIKPTVIFIFFAILIYEICINLPKLKRTILILDTKKLRSFFTKIILSVVSIFIAVFISAGVCNYGVEINDEDSFTFSHFLMMGINFENKGAWNIDDVNISRSYPTVESRQQANIKQWQSRLTKYGPLDISWILFNKTLTNYSDGSFAWEGETPWMLENKGNNNFIKFIYGIDEADAHNDNNIGLAYLRQILWLMILTGCAFTLFRKNINRSEYIMILAILAISAFLTFFEPDPRYLLLYLPIYAIISINGWSYMYLKWNTKLFNLLVRNKFISNFISKG